MRPAVNAFKERGRAELARPLGAALALAVAGVLAGLSARPGPVRLVPVPSSTTARRARGRDHVRELTARAVAELRAAGVPAAEARLLRRSGRVADSAGLSAAQRRANLAGTFTLRPGPLELPATAVLVVVDDVVTSGATLTEAAAVLASATGRGGSPVLAAVVAATPRHAVPGAPARPRGSGRSTVGTRPPGLAWVRSQPERPGGLMEIVVRGRNVEVPEHYRQHVEDKVGQSDRFDGKLKILRIDVELFHEKNPRQSGKCQRVEITLRGKGPVVRAEAAASDFYAALDLAAGKLDHRLRKAADRRRVHHGRRTPASVRVSGGAPDSDVAESLDRDRELAEGTHVTDLDEHLPGQIVREKHHPATPMHVDQALHEMELVGHDFFLFMCADTGHPTVVYRRHAYDYGLIRLVDPPLDGAARQSASAAEPAAARA